jgi:hypothetical protein
MLLAFAVENEAKGFLVAKAPHLVDGQSGLDKSLRTHDVRALVDQCGIKVSELEAEVLDRLTEFAKWGGRYPIPLRALGATPVVGAWVKQRMGPDYVAWESGRALFDRMVATAGWQPVPVRIGTAAVG